ncbi:MAG: MaoC family dehydratase [Candidatus Acidiferrales bacterium]
MPLVIDTPHALKDFIGRELGVSEWFTVTQDRIRRFADSTEDHQWIHEDADRARRESPYGTAIAHGFLTLSLIGHLARQAFEVRGVRLIVNYGLNRVRFPSPVLADSRIRARVALQSLKEFPDCFEAALLVTVEGENAPKPCCVVEWLVRYYV